MPPLQCSNPCSMWRSQSKGVPKPGTQNSRDQKRAPAEIHHVEHMYKKGHREGRKNKGNMDTLIGELSGHGSICPQSHREECLWP